MMNYEQWIEKYNPKQNHIDTNASFDGMMFETYGEEFNFIATQNPKTIWTLVNGVSETTFLVSGYHLVDRIGYFITEEEWEDENFEVAIDEYTPIADGVNVAIKFIQKNISVNNFVADELRSFIDSKLFEQEREENLINVNILKYHVIDYITDELEIEIEEFEDDIHNYWSEHF